MTGREIRNRQGSENKNRIKELKVSILNKESREGSRKQSRKKRKEKKSRIHGRSTYCLQN